MLVLKKGRTFVHFLHTTLRGKGHTISIGMPKKNCSIQMRNKIPRVPETDFFRFEKNRISKNKWQ